MKIRYVAAMGVISLGVTAFVAARANDAPDTTPPAEAHALEVIAGPGRVEARSEEIEVAPEVSGKMAAVLVDEGDAVKRHDIVARLEQRDYVARVSAASARLRVAEAELQRLVNGARSEERREAAAAAAEAGAELDHARIQVERSRRLFAEGVIAREALDAAERDVNVAAAKQAAAAQRAALVDADARLDERSRAEAAVELARANLEEANAVLAKTVIRAPIDGTVVRRHKLPGESVSLDGPDTAVITIADLDVLRVRMEVDERDVAAVRVGQPAWVRAGAFGDQRFPGRVVRVAPMLGRKEIRTDEPSERIDTKVLEVLIELDRGIILPIGLRVDAFLDTKRVE